MTRGAVPEFRFDGPPGARLTLALTHGSGAPMGSPFMAAMAGGIAATGVRVARFEFPFIAARRRDGVRKPPDPMTVLEETWWAVVAALGPDDLVIGGKSLGGRAASMIADAAQVRGLVCLGYPFHPAGKPDRLRVDHLKTLVTPTLIVQGERDPLGSRKEVDGYTLSPAIDVAWIADGDHNFRPRKAAGRTERQNWDAAIESIAVFLEKL